MYFQIIRLIQILHGRAVGLLFFVLYVKDIQMSSASFQIEEPKQILKIRCVKTPFVCVRMLNYIKNYNAHICVYIRFNVTSVSTNKYMEMQIILVYALMLSLLNQSGWTPLHFASYKGYTDIVLLLLNRGANTEAQDDVSVSIFIQYIRISIYAYNVNHHPYVSNSSSHITLYSLLTYECVLVVHIQYIGMYLCISFSHSLFISLDLLLLNLVHLEVMQISSAFFQIKEPTQKLRIMYASDQDFYINDLMFSHKPLIVLFLCKCFSQ